MYQQMYNHTSFRFVFHLQRFIVAYSYKPNYLLYPAFADNSVGDVICHFFYQFPKRCREKN